MGSIPNYDDSGVLDVLIVGAGISGINVAYRLTDECPDKKFLIVENRDTLGGTWDLFKYPGIRSDSDLHTFGYAFKAWEGADIASGESIKAYLKQVSDENGITEKTRYSTKVTSANFSTEERCWNVELDHRGQKSEVRSRFLFLATGYYDYNQPLKAEIPGISNFGGKVVHPQFWDLTEADYTDKRVVVIGSGATAITLLPSMAEKTKDITMLQRSPSYIVSLDKFDPIAKWIRRLLPASIAAKVIRQKNIARIYASYHVFRTFPGIAKRILGAMTKSQLPKSVPLDPHFKPSYNPWDQRLCICPDGDFYQSLRSGKAHIVTGHIAEVKKDEIVLKDGQRLPADIIVTATGLKLAIGGNIDMQVDGKRVDASNRYVWKGAMLEGVPNMALSIGYTNASWTLGSDCTAMYLCRLLKHLDTHHQTLVVPEPKQREQLKQGPLLNLNSTYVVKASDDLPKAATSGPFRMRTNYWYDLLDAKYGSYSELKFR
ncbi:uncharacterized protein PFL1_01799 [Pseudozyma flocculosa PF-1]|uniref:Probable monooxygenase n=1 Tax=Pseudozyma flocculosa TaxID=84751 RepID=A0A5C3EYI9_9BASI|nr:uncharacterized protein PFL1_01799 [Pseudozyma flocculosa PF-1]EPQ30901.1 hypothetical protein PFL1_01799 [Pseudozyma flocculosa PF-1]SPO36716.1 probable monooxygenase [Pseudozyma flocculosa]